MNKNNSVGYVLRISLVLLIICSLTAAAVSLVYVFTYRKAEENLLLEKRSAMEQVFGKGIDAETASSVDGIEIDRITLAGETVGYGVMLSENGFGGELSVLVGYESDGSIRGVRLIAHSETPGFGSRVGEESYLSQYIGKSGTLALGSDIDAITSSTISSKAMLAAVNRAGAALGAFLGGDRG